MISNSKAAEEELSLFYSALTGIESEAECRAFFEDICTPKELYAFAQRLNVAVRLRAGQSFNVISQETGASTATISRVSRCLSFGPGGYDSVLKKVGK